MPHLLANAVGVIAALCSMSSFVPQIVKMVRERKAEAVSFPMYVVTVAGFVFWIAYGVAIMSWPVAVSNAVNLVLAAAILVLKMRYSKRGLIKTVIPRCSGEAAECGGPMNIDTGR